MSGIISKNASRILLGSIVCLIALQAPIYAGYSVPAQRSVICINKSWTFIKQNVSGAQATGFNDASWSKINLPHCFDIPYWRVNSAVSPLMGWYRKHLSINSNVISSGKRVFIEFGAAFLVATVYVNGDSIGVHKGGYTGFSYDITSHLHSGDNVVAVYLDASWNAQVAPRAGDHIFLGGIYRDVNLVITDPLHVTWYGTFVTTPQVSASSATVKVQTEIKNDATAAETCTVVSIVTDSAGNEVTRFQSSMAIPAGVLDTFTQVSSAIANPHLWSPKTPYMYTVNTEVYNGTRLVDNFSSPLGIRTILWDKSTGFFINGTHVWLQGCNEHQDHAGWGPATTDSGCTRDVRLVKACGMNFIRGSHYPHHPVFSDACDKLGICLWQEMCYWGMGGTGTEPNTQWNASAYPTVSTDFVPFENNVKQQLREMIRIHRNHPSVIVWSMGNEVFFNSAATMQRAKDLVTSMVAVTNLSDSTRLAGMGGVQRQGFDKLVQVAGYNGDGASIASYQNPGFPTMVAEYGICKETRPGNYIPCWGKDVQTTIVNGDTVPIQYAWRSGVAMWCGFHYGSSGTIAGKGMLDHARLPLKRWYYYRAKFAGIPPPVWSVTGTATKLKLTKDNDTLTDDGKSDCQLIVQVQNAAGAWLNSQPNITLTDINGQGLFPGGTSITFTGGATEKGVLDGLAAIEYRSYTPGTMTIVASSPGLASDTMKIYVKHVTDSIPTFIKNTSLIRLSPAVPMNLTLKVQGTMLRLPNAMTGKKIAFSVFTLQGKLIESRVIENRTGVIRLMPNGKAQGINIVKLKTLD